MSSSQYNYITASISAPMDMKFVYKAEEMVFSGWQAVDSKQNTNESVAAFRLLTNLKQDTSIKCKKILATFTVQELKSHYTEANLVKILEDKGIGRPSTFASIIDKIMERNYVEKQNVEGKQVDCVDFLLDNTNKITEMPNKREFGNEKGKLVIQPLGIIVIEFLLKHFPTFFDYAYTKEMEDSLDKIANGLIKWPDVCKMCNNELTNIIDGLKDLKKFEIRIDNEYSIINFGHNSISKQIELTKLTHYPQLK
jgi:DNA topoisomerase-1